MMESCECPTQGQRQRLPIAPRHPLPSVDLQSCSYTNLFGQDLDYKT